MKSTPVCGRFPTRICESGSTISRISPIGCLQHLLKSDEAVLEVPKGNDFVLVARNLGPAQLLDYHGGSLKAVVLEEGSPNSHVAIVARALDIPVVGQVRDALARIEIGDLLIVDADHSQILVRPGEDVRLLFRKSLAARNERKAQYAALKGLPAVSRDGVAVSISINAGLLMDLQQLAETDADGVGLYRTEVPFMIRSDLPDVESQRQLYSKILGYANGKPVVFRTLDIGGDKVMPYWDHGEDEIRPWAGAPSGFPSIDRRCCASSSGLCSVRRPDQDLYVMFPMIAEVRELGYARSLLDREVERGTRQRRSATTSSQGGRHA